MVAAVQQKRKLCKAKKSGGSKEEEYPAENVELRKLYTEQKMRHRHPN